MTAFARRFSPLLLGLLFSAVASAIAPYLVDGDGDGVSDEIDECPYTHPGVQVNAKGCPLRRDDGDLDGVPDEDDDCPYSAPGAIVDVHGCALDTDFDGVANGIDRCPHTALALPVDARGCAAGERAEAAAPRAVIATSKPTATAAKATPAPIPPQILTPPPVITVPAATATTPSPVVLPAASAGAEAPEMLLRFGPNSSNLSKGDLATLAGYARVFARKLAADPVAKLHISAYADYRETEVAALAAARAAAVRAALLQKGIAPERIKTENGVLRDRDASRNRRVEVELGN